MRFDIQFCAVMRLEPSPVASRVDEKKTLVFHMCILARSLMDIHLPPPTIMITNTLSRAPLTRKSA